MTQDADARQVFSTIFREDTWQGTVKSGPGSSLKVTERLRAALAERFAALEVRTLCDAPCGDCTWIHEITGSLDFYFGIDVVPELIVGNLAKGFPLNHLFRYADITRETPPRVDAIFCRDCLVHLPFEAATSAINHFKASGSKYLFATTFIRLETNTQARMGTWRPLNMQKPPFEFPPPLDIIRERQDNPQDKYADKSIGVWKIADLPNYG